jgi:ABC-type amino acid transport substrate-binding protein
MVLRGLAWDDLLQAPSRGQADLIVSSITKLAEREPNYGILFSDPYFCTGYALIYRVGERDRSIGEMIRDRTVGYQLETTGAKVANGLGKNIPFKARGYASTELIVKAVAAAEIDFGITDTPFAEAAEIEERAGGRQVLAHKQFKATDLPSDIQSVQEYALAVPAGDHQFVEVINSLLRSMKAQGKLASLFRDLAAEYENEKKLKSGSRTDPRTRPWECAP